ncbi:MAG: hypothetical protein F9K40_18525 [Kofleriaceae bacterium]|nr:MAG: hypothetical protein F9K40_18525 [Kofleriaceae bacterium]MBZ0234756.1 hypothetical protein [Kofleriaceae bacterium]
MSTAERRARLYWRAVFFIVGTAVAILLFAATSALLRWRASSELKLAVELAKVRVNVLSNKIGALEVAEIDGLDPDDEDGFAKETGRQLQELTDVASDTDRALRIVSEATNGAPIRATRGTSGRAAVSCAGGPIAMRVAPGDWQYNLRCAARHNGDEVTVSVKVEATAFPVDATEAIELTSGFECWSDGWKIARIDRSIGKYAGVATCRPETNPLEWQVNITCPWSAEKCVGTFQVEVTPLPPKRDEPKPDEPE